MAKKLPPDGYLLGLDIGDKRIGTALAGAVAKLPRPANIIAAGEDANAQIEQLIKNENVKLVVVGLPRNQQGEETAQSQKIRLFVDSLSKKIKTPVVYADESLSSHRAEKVIKSGIQKDADEDSLAACFILEEFIGGNINNYG